MNIKSRMQKILRLLKKEYPDTKTALFYGTPFQLLAATILSAQATDTLVNKVTEPIFRKYKTADDFLKLSEDELQLMVRSINYYKTKTKNILSCARIIKEQFHSKVPKTMQELVTLPGVARKTANIVLAEAYGINEGIAVDTHVKRLAARLGLSNHTDPVKIEQDLMQISPNDEWNLVSNLLISHGRKVCNAKKPKHDICVLYDICPSNDI
ncbi:MAG: endonuclease III [Nitrospiraceae bacterium]|nr:endonuclease III [Nitrospiraceae bacterium]